MKKLFIDDLRTICDVYHCSETNDFDIARDFTSAIEYMQRNGCPKFISFDHDLGLECDSNGVELSGFAVVKWMVEKDLDSNGTFIPVGFTYYVHSANPQGKENIRGLLDNYLRFRDGNRD